MKNICTSGIILWLEIRRAVSVPTSGDDTRIANRIHDNRNAENVRWFEKLVLYILKFNNMSDIIQRGLSKIQKYAETRLMMANSGEFIHRPFLLNQTRNKSYEKLVLALMCSCSLYVFVLCLESKITDDRIRSGHYAFIYVIPFGHDLEL
jgi:hypothetical protein